MSRAIQAVNVRNAHKSEAWAAMTNRALAERLAKDNPLLYVRELVEEAYKEHSLKGDALWEHVLKKTTRTRSSVNRTYGIENQKSRLSA